MTVIANIMASKDPITYYISIRTRSGERGLVGFYFIFDDGRHAYMPSTEDIPKYKKYIKHKRFLSEAISDEGPIDFIEEMMQDEYLDRSRGPKTWHWKGYVIERVPKRTSSRYVFFRNGAEKGQPGYSMVEHVIPHCEGNGPTGINEWVQHYTFYKMDDGSYEAELDMAWYWGGSHCDGGEVTADIPSEWFDLPYEEFLAKVLTLVCASRFLFTVEELLSRPRLKKFFGYK